MFMFAFLSTFLVLSRIRVDDAADRNSPGMPGSNIIKQSIRRHSSSAESAFYEDSLQLPRRRLLEHPRWPKQAYRGGDYNVARKSKPEDGRSYRSAVKDEEDEDEDEDEENENENEDDEKEEDRINDETADEAADEAEQANDEEEDEEETVEEAGRSRVARSGYVPLMSKVDDRDGQDVVKIRSAGEEQCEDTSTEILQYYEYETEVKNDAASQGGGESRKTSTAKTLGASLLIFLLA